MAILTSLSDVNHLVTRTARLAQSTAMLSRLGSDHSRLVFATGLCASDSDSQ